MGLGLHLALKKGEEEASMACKLLSQTTKRRRCHVVPMLLDKMCCWKGLADGQICFSHLWIDLCLCALATSKVSCSYGDNV